MTTQNSTSSSSTTKTTTTTPSSTKEPEASTISTMGSTTTNPPTTTTSTTTTKAKETTISTMGSSTTDPPTTITSSTTKEAEATTISTMGSTTTDPPTTTTSSTDKASTTISAMDSTTSESTTVSPTTQDTTTMSTTMESTTSDPTTREKPTVKIFVTDEGTNNKIFVADLQDELNFTSIPSTQKPRFITYDSVDKKIYWTDLGEMRVYRADVDGGNREAVTHEGSYERRGIAIAETSRTLYISNKNAITSVSIGEGSTIPGDETDFETLGKREPISLEVDEEQEYLYWTDTGGNIRRISLDGNRVTTTFYTFRSLSHLYGLSIGPSSGYSMYIFFCDFGDERSFYFEEEDVETYPTDLTDDLRASGYDRAGEKLRDIAYFDGVLYWTKADDPSSIAVMTDYQSASSRSYEIKETSGIATPYQLLITNVYP